GRERGGTGRCDDHSDPSAGQVGRQRRQSIELILGPAVFDRDVLAFDIARFLEALPKPPHEVCGSISRSGVEKPDPRHCRLLRARRGRPCPRRAANESEELAPPHHSITSSARASSCGGTARPSARAVFRLITVSYLVGCCTRRSAGFSPLRMRST